MHHTLPVLFAGALVLPWPTHAGECSPPFAVVVEQRSYVDAARGNRQVPVRIHRPAQGAGGPLPAACGLGLIAFGHGFTIPNTAYDYLGNGLAAAGYLVVLPATESGISPNHLAFGLDLAFALRVVATDSAYAAALGPLRAVGGHSMGGGAAVQAAASDAGSGALFALAPAETSPSAIAAATQVDRPARFILGSRDCVTPRAQHGQAIFDALATPVEDRSLHVVDGASHCQFTTGSITCSIGEGTCGGTATITAASQQAATLALLQPWLASLSQPGELVYADGFEATAAASAGVPELVQNAPRGD